MKLLGKGLTQAEVAYVLGVSEPTALRWKVALKKKGPSAWRRGKLGRPLKVLSPHLPTKPCTTRLR
ncbi:MAG: hypothetical protein RIS76_4590 [Verrucomicrobiota bacterium]|jgi:transposase